MGTLFAELGMTIPVVAAPMAGGPTTPAMVLAAREAGGLGFLAAGYKSPEAVEAEVQAVAGASIPFGVNVFAPNPVPIAPAEYRRYAALMQHEADQFGITLPPDPIDDDDHFTAKIDVLLAAAVPVVSFTFGIPDRGVITALQKAGSLVAQTVTSRREAERATGAGVNILVVQGSSAGGHSGTLTPHDPPPTVTLTDLVAEVTATAHLPVIAAGGLATSDDIAGVLRAGAQAAAVGTVLLLADESGTSATHQGALKDPLHTETTVTHAFTGRPARGLRNRFIDTYQDTAPLGYPAVHHLTSPLRKAAAAAGKPDLVHLWAGTGYRQARHAPTAQILTDLAP